MKPLAKRAHDTLTAAIERYGTAAILENDPVALMAQTTLQWLQKLVERRAISCLSLVHNLAYELTLSHDRLGDAAAARRKGKGK